MKSVLYYLVQVTIASGILYGYYHFALRNKKFHHYNRFYLLSAIVISMLVPFLNIPIYFSEETTPSVVFQGLSAISTKDVSTDIQTSAAAPVLIAHAKTHWLTWQNLSFLLYILVSCLVLLKIAFSIRRIRSIIRRNAVEKLDDIYFVNTNEPGTPFSFFRWLFWNRNIELGSEKGEQVFRHELFHIQQKHSWDVIFMELTTVVFWINPFSHLMKRELKAIHEFLADEFAIRQNDKWEYAELLLMQALNTQNHLLNPFFNNQIKRRIAMITSSKSPGYQYLRKIFVLPVAAIVFMLFAFSYKAKLDAELIIIKGDVRGLPDGKVYLTEAHYWNIKLFPAYDSTIAKDGRFEFRIKPGQEFYPYVAAIVFPDDQAISKLAGLLFENNHSSGFFLERGVTKITGTGKLMERTSGGGASLPVTINAGKQNDVYAKYIEFDFSLSTQQEKRAKQFQFCKKLIKESSYSYYLLQSIFDNRGQYSQSELTELMSLFDEDVRSSTLAGMLKDYIANGPEPGDLLTPIIDTIPPKILLRETVNKTSTVTHVVDADTIPKIAKKFNDALIIVDGKERTVEELNALDPGNIESISVLKDKSAIEKYGDKGKNGVIVIVTKTTKSVNEELNNEDVAKSASPISKEEAKQLLQKVLSCLKTGDVESFVRLWYLDNTVDYNNKIFDRQQVINEFADLKKFMATPIIKGSPIDRIVIEETTPFFKARYKIKAYFKIDDTLSRAYGFLVDRINGKWQFRWHGETTIAPHSDLDAKMDDAKTGDKKIDKVWTKVEVEASFPGGETAWRKFLTDNLNAQIPLVNKAPDGKYTIWVKFIVSKDGSLSDFTARTNHGYGMEKEVIRVMKLSPRWNPAMQGGKKVTAYRMQPVTFVVADDRTNAVQIPPSPEEKKQNQAAVSKGNKENYLWVKTEVPVSFPGGLEAQQKFIYSNNDRSVAAKNGAPGGDYTVWVQFIVDEEGNASDWKALTNFGYGMEEEALKVIKKVPKWVPAMQNGHKVRAYHKVPVGFGVERKISAAALRKIKPFSLLELNPGEELIRFSIIIDAVGVKEPPRFDITGNDFPGEVQTIFSNIQTTTYIYLENIAVKADGKIQRRPPMYYTVIADGSTKSNNAIPVQTFADNHLTNFNDPEVKKQWQEMIAEIKAIAWKEGKAAYVYKGRTYVFGRIINPDPHVASFTEQNGTDHVFLLNGELVSSIDEINKRYARKDIIKFRLIFPDEALKRFNRNEAIVEIETADNYLTKK